VINRWGCVSESAGELRLCELQMIQEQCTALSSWSNLVTCRGL